MSEPYAVITTDSAPIIHVQVVAEPNDVNYAAYLDGLAAELRKYERVALVFNTGKLAAFPARYREMQSRWLAETRAEFEGRWVAAAFVIPNRVIRGVLMTLLWMNPPYYAHTVVSTDDEAFRWVEKQLATGGVPRAAGEP